MHDIAAALAQVHQRIQLACRHAGRDESEVSLLAVSKTFGPASIAAAAATGQRDFGESYAQEFLRKRPLAEEIAGAALCWHFIGPVQGNKTAAIAAACDWVHSIERLRVAERLAVQRPGGRGALNVCVQVNISGEAAKSGCTPAEAGELCAAIARLEQLRLRGLMGIPAADATPEAARAAFRALRGLRDSIRTAGAVDPAYFDTLSMGMSGDLEIAIEEGATIVRIGTAIFGSRGSART